MGNNQKSSTTTSFGGRSGTMPKVIVIMLCQDLLLKTDGTATYVDQLLESEELATLGPMIKQIRVHLTTENATANFRVKVNLAWSMLGRTWNGPYDLITPATGNVQLIGAWYTDDTKFGLNLRSAVTVSNAAGVAIESGRVSVALEVELKS